VEPLAPRPCRFKPPKKRPVQLTEEEEEGGGGGGRRRKEEEGGGGGGRRRKATREGCSTHSLLLGRTMSAAAAPAPDPRR